MIKIVRDDCPCTGCEMGWSSYSSCPDCGGAIHKSCQDTCELLKEWGRRQQDNINNMFVEKQTCPTCGGTK